MKIYYAPKSPTLALNVLKAQGLELHEVSEKFLLQWLAADEAPSPEVSSPALAASRISSVRFIPWARGTAWRVEVEFFK